MKKYLYLLIVIVTFSACHRNDFTVTGNVSDAEGKTLYFEATQIDKIVTLDSIKLKSDGKFTFYAPKTEFPEFYRLRLDSSYIHFAIDSTETVAFHTSGKSFTDYSVEGSEENKQIQEVSKAGSLLKNEVDKILSNLGRRSCHGPGHRNFGQHPNSECQKAIKRSRSIQKNDLTYYIRKPKIKSRLFCHFPAS